jgi:hypothetical protein
MRFDTIGYANHFEDIPDTATANLKAIHDALKDDNGQTTTTQDGEAQQQSTPPTTITTTAVPQDTS